MEARDTDDGSYRMGSGLSYGELVIALVFLRSLRRQLTDFELTAGCFDAGRFHDVVLTWRENRDKHALLVELKHDMSQDLGAIRRDDLFPQGDKKPYFNIRKYHSSYRSIERGLRGRNFALVVSTNASLHENASVFFERRETSSVVWADLLDTGGSVYMLAAQTVKFDHDFLEHFYVLFGQKNIMEIRDDICTELKHLLGSPGPSETHSACEELCKCVVKWKDGQCMHPKSLTSSWSEWTDIESRYKSKDCTIS